MRQIDALATFCPLKKDKKKIKKTLDNAGEMRLFQALSFSQNLGTCIAFMFHNCIHPRTV